jgi:hypothetical protein
MGRVQTAGSQSSTFHGQACQNCLPNVGETQSVGPQGDISFSKLSSACRSSSVCSTSQSPGYFATDLFFAPIGMLLPQVRDDQRARRPMGHSCQGNAFCRGFQP